LLVTKKLFVPKKLNPRSYIIWPRRIIYIITLYTLYIVIVVRRLGMGLLLKRIMRITFQQQRQVRAYRNLLLYANYKRFLPRLITCRFYEEELLSGSSQICTHSAVRLRVNLQVPTYCRYLHNIKNVVVPWGIQKLVSD